MVRMVPTIFIRNAATVSDPIFNNAFSPRHKAACTRQPVWIGGNNHTVRYGDHQVIIIFLLGLSSMLRFYRSSAKVADNFIFSAHFLSGTALPMDSTPWNLRTPYPYLQTVLLMARRSFLPRWVKFRHTHRNIEVHDTSCQ